ncbi:MAG TPA: hypothetical protein VE935_07465 [Burkholderiales bacterium]|jgi:hypothetical protein|nr:hypothetical protein [Burkholderiales bacterium]
MNAARALFVVLGAVALALLLQRPLCAAAHPQMHAGETPSCCQVAGAATAAKPLGLLIDTGGKPLVAPVAFAYLAAATLFLAGATRFVRRAPAPPRSYYARSSRILR